METKLKPYQLGIIAAQEGKSIFEFPYRVGSKEYEQWMDGYMKMDRTIKFNVK